MPETPAPTAPAPPTIDLRPLDVRCRGYQGDPFDWAVELRHDGELVDVEGWEWQGWIELGGGVVVPWLCTPEPHGVALYLRGQDTARIPSHFCPFDVSGRDPDAGEGRTVVRGYMLCSTRVTPPLRGRSPGTVEPHEAVGV